jgi:cell division protein ZapB
MISEFQDLSDKIERLAELVGSLRRENALLRQTNKLLSEENMAFVERLTEAQRRVEAVIERLPAPAGEEGEALDTEAGQ